MKGKRLLNTVLSITSILALAGCTTSLKKYKGGSNTIVEPEGKLQASSHIIYFKHFDGEGNQDFADTEAGMLPAIVKFEFQAIGDDYMGLSPESSEQHIKYQVSYLACNCRSSQYNAWTDIYVEMSADKAAIDNHDNARITKILFEGSAFEDDYGHHTEVAHWGDSPAMDRNNNPYASEYAKQEGLHGATKEDFQNELAPLLTTTKFIEGNEAKGLNKATLDAWMGESSYNKEGYFEHELIEFFEDTKVTRYKAYLDGLEAIGYENKQYQVSINDAYAGASVSLDNMLSVLQALFEYHSSLLTDIKNDSNNDLFYNYSTDTEFKGTYKLEKADSETTTHITKEQLQSMIANNGTYLIYAASEGCSTCQAFAKPLNKYVKQMQQKIYEIPFADAKPLFSDLSSLNAPQLFLISNGRIIEILSEEARDTAISKNSYKVIFSEFTQDLLSAETID